VDGEGDVDAEELLDLGLVAVARGRVRADDARAFGMARGLAAAGAALARSDLDVDDYLLVPAQDVVFEQGQQAHDRRRGVAAAGGNQVRTGQVLAVEFGERVLRLGKQFGARVPVVPLVVLRLGVEAEVRRQVDDGVRGILKGVDLFHRDAVGRRGEQHVHRLQVLGAGEPQVQVAEVRVGVAHRLVLLRATRGLCGLELGVAIEDAEQLATGEAGSPTTLAEWVMC